MHEPLVVPWLWQQLWTNVFATRLHRLPDFVRFSSLLLQSDDYFRAMSWTPLQRPRVAVLGAFASALGVSMSAAAFFVAAVADPTFALPSGVPLLLVLGCVLAGFVHTALFTKVLPDRTDAQTAAIVCWPAWLLFAIAIMLAVVPASVLLDEVLVRVLFVCVVVACVSAIFAAVAKFWRHESTALGLGCFALPMLLAGFASARLGAFGDDTAAKWAARSWVAVLWPSAVLPVLVAGAIYKEGIDIFYAW